MEKYFRSNLVSIVVPTYNQVNYIDETITSIISQSYSDIEILICDDCSSDGTTEKISDWARKDARIVPILSPKNEGLSRNVNRGFERAQGEFFSLMGGDDKMRNDKIEKQVKFLRENPEYDVVLHWVEVFDSNTGNNLYLIDSDILESPGDWFLAVKSFWAFSKDKNSTFPPTSYLARSTYALHGRYDTRLNYKNEVLFAIDNFMNKPLAKWHCIPEILGYYRIHNNNIHRSDEMRIALLEETYINYGIASARYPSLTGRLKNVLVEFLYKRIVYLTQASQGFSKREIDDEMKRLRYEAGFIKYLFCVISIKIKLTIRYFRT